MNTDKNRNTDPDKSQDEEKLGDLSKSGMSQLEQDLEIVRRAARDKNLEVGDTFSGSDGGSAGDGGAA